jgi:sugar phosphate isomerase/epimerase
VEIGVFSVLFADRSLDAALDIIADIGASCVELPSGGFAPKSHCDPAALLESEGRIRGLRNKVEERGLFISALGCSGNPLHPSPEISQEHTNDLRETVQLAGRLGVERVIVFAGCPGDSEDATVPNWVTCPWPDYYSDLLAWQWREKVVPFWTEMAAYAEHHGVKKLCFEMHPGDTVYNPETLLKLRRSVGDMVGANLDPSHLFWQGINPVIAIRELGRSIYHVHAKDTKIDEYMTSRIGVLDTKHYQNYTDRSWNFRTVGYGHGREFWKEFVSMLRAVGYDYVLSIEHEDQQMSIMEGLKKAMEFLKDVSIAEKAEKPWFAA